MTLIALYRHFDASGGLLYVGISRDPLKRLDAHAKGSSWVYEIANISLDWFESREEASDAEREAISSERPLYNIQYARGGNTPVEEMISRWPARRELANEIGANVAAVHKWATAGRIPSNWQASVIRAAQARGFSEVSAEWMVAVHADREGAA